MLVFGAVAPATPLLLSTIGGEHTKELVSTRYAVERLADELFVSRPDVLVLLSGSPGPIPNIFSANLCDAYRTDLSEFGDLTAYPPRHPECRFVDALQRWMRRKSELPFNLFSESLLDERTAVSALLLAPSIPLPIVPLLLGDASPKSVFEFGRALKEVCSVFPRRIAVCVSGDLSHRLSVEAPGGFHEAGPRFDAAVREAIRSSSPSSLLRLDEEDVQQASPLGYRPLLALFGILEGTGAVPEELSYEASYGVGHLVAQFTL
ncbi:MAG TPA: class III extradiol dioxygenase subunit B-like domain-containing protein [Patescibacteria group bacterium]|nr:class III extradiol dioxygenase subunit B-like domain-containing protein [Patescibacteria group bacterium]